ncbi:MAG: T9SS type A sorting domain-containing protein, partial [Bacteroidales bacterium]|nr:T9SS type A sorting domain-containing protein [Bacteroidales bacterium]
TDGHALAITFKEATHLKAIGTITVLDEKVTTSLLDEELKIKSADMPAFSLNGAEVKVGEKLVIENPNPYPEMPEMPEDYWDNEESAAAYEEAYAAYEEAVAAIPATIMYFSFDGTQPTSVAYDGQPDYEYDKWNVFKTEEGQDVTVFFQMDKDGYYLYVPEVIGYNTLADTIRLSGDAFTLKAMSVTTEKAEGEGGGGVPAPLTAKVIPGGGDFAFMYGSDFATAEYKVVKPAVTLTFDPASGSEVEENTAVTITATGAEVELFYMMFESEEAAKAAAWDQEKALSYSAELKPVLSKEKTTVKVAYAYESLEAVENEFFYATYTVKELPAITLTFNPASGSEVEDNTTVTVTASRETEIFYILYADKAAADADTTFMANAKEVKEDGMPVITKEATYLRCAVSDKGEMVYFDAAYTIKTANEDLELAGVSVYPNPSNGMFNIELPVAATIEVFMSNGMLYQRVKALAGNATLNIERSGIYFLRITGEGRTAIKRVIVR